MTRSAAAVMNSDPACLYQGLVDIVKHTAEICGLRISPETMRRWEALVRAARALDECIDQAVAARDEDHLVEMLLAALTLFSGNMIVTDPRPDFQALPLQVRLELGKFRAACGDLGRAPLAIAAMRIAIFALSKAQQRSAVLYTTGLFEEGHVTGMLFIACMTDAEKYQNGYPLFVQWLTEGFMTLAVLADHIVDLNDDWLNGRTLVPARPWSYAVMGLGATASLARLLRSNSVVFYRVMRRVAPELRALIRDYRAKQIAA